MCVKSCPSSDKSVPVECKQPTFFAKNPSKYANCMYYPYGTSESPVRYDTKKCKLQIKEVIFSKIDMNKFCLPTVDAIKD